MLLICSTTSSIEPLNRRSAGPRACVNKCNVPESNSLASTFLLAQLATTTACVESPELRILCIGENRHPSIEDFLLISTAGALGKMS